MALRVSANLARRLDAVDRVTRRSDLDQRYQLATVLGRQILTKQEMCELTVWQRTVLSWTGVLTIDEWEALALDTQEQLVRETADWLGPASVSSGRDPDDVSHRYKPDRSKIPPAIEGSEA